MESDQDFSTALNRQSKGSWLGVKLGAEILYKYRKRGGKTIFMQAVSRCGLMPPIRELLRGLGGIFLVPTGWKIGIFLAAALSGCSGEISTLPTISNVETTPENGEVRSSSDSPRSTVNKSQVSQDPSASSGTNTDKELSTDPGKVISESDAGNGTVTYPEILLKGKGETYCDGDVFTTVTTAKSRLSETEFVMQLAEARVYTNRFEDRVNQELNANRSEVRYTLVPVAERSKLDGKDLAIFATSSLQVKKNIRWTFSNPIPVYIWPAPTARFEKLKDKGSQTWAAQVTGSKQFDVRITLTYVSSLSGNRTTIRMETEIPQDRMGELYEDFPVPKLAEITVDGDRQIVEKSRNENHFWGDRSCDEKRGIVKLDYQACTRTAAGKVEDLGCPR